jgi:dienelactone hydrolase
MWGVVPNLSCFQENLLSVEPAATHISHRKIPGFPIAGRSIVLTALLLATFLAATVAAQQPTDGAQFARWRTEIKNALYVPTPLPSLHTQMYGSFTPAEGVIADRVTYGTQFDMRVPAIVYHPLRTQRRLPAIIVVNGHGGDKHSWYSFYTGVLYARAGAVVLTYDPIGEGERNEQRKSGTREHDRAINTPHTPARMGGLMVTDVMQAVSYLLSRPDVDPARIAVAGYSMGSFIGALAGAVDLRIHALVLSGGGDLDENGGYWDSSNKLMCQAGPYKALSFLPDKAAVLIALNQLRGPTYIMNGTADTIVDIPHHMEPFFDDLRKRSSALSGTTDNLPVTYFIPNVSHRPSFVTKPAALWLEGTLHFPNWTDATIKTLPETHVSAWAVRNGIFIDRGYISEDKEGGVMALSDSVPGYTDASLNVLTDAQWKQQQSFLVYGSWMQHALAADGITGAAAAAAVVSVKKK